MAPPELDQSHGTPSRYLGEESPPGNEERPGGEPQALCDRLAAASHIVSDQTHEVMCPRCGRVLTSRRSLRLGYGRECWALLSQRSAA